MKANDECRMQDAELGTTRLFRADMGVYSSITSEFLFIIHHSAFIIRFHPSSFIPHPSFSPEVTYG